MISNQVFRTAVILALLFIQLPILRSQDCPDKGISPGEYALRRQVFMDQLDSSDALVMKAGDAASEYETMHFRQDLNFLYLTGLQTPGCYLFMDKGGINLEGRIKYTIFFAPVYSDVMRSVTSYSNESDTLLATDEFTKIFASSLSKKKRLYYSAPGLGFNYDWLNDKPYFILKEARKNLKQKFPGITLIDAGILIRKMREIKSLQEEALIREAIRLTGDGLLNAMKVCKPGTWEYELRAAVEYEMIRQGAETESFHSIIGSGTNSLILHYDKNSCQTKEGDLVVMDVGAQVGGYAADITRTIPVSGKFTKEQLEIYNCVLVAQNEAIKMIRPGITFADLDKKTTEVITKAGFKRYIQHGVSHPVGLDVHDVSSGDTLRPGMVITVEPGLYIPLDDKNLPPAYHGFGIRIEDDILVTGDGYENLSITIPKDPAIIERRMK